METLQKNCGQETAEQEQEEAMEVEEGGEDAGEDQEVEAADHGQEAKEDMEEEADEGEAEQADEPEGAGEEEEEEEEEEEGEGEREEEAGCLEGADNQQEHTPGADVYHMFGLDPPVSIAQKVKRWPGWNRFKVQRVLRFLRPGKPKHQLVKELQALAAKRHRGWTRFRQGHHFELCEAPSPLEDQRGKVPEPKVKMNQKPTASKRQDTDIDLWSIRVGLRNAIYICIYVHTAMKHIDSKYMFKLKI